MTDSDGHMIEGGADCGPAFDIDGHWCQLVQRTEAQKGKSKSQMEVQRSQFCSRKLYYYYYDYD